MTTYHGSEAKVAVNIDNTVAYKDVDQVQSLSIDFDRAIVLDKIYKSWS